MVRLQHEHEQADDSAVVFGDPDLAGVDEGGVVLAHRRRFGAHAFDVVHIGSASQLRQQRGIAGACGSDRCHPCSLPCQVRVRRV